MAKKKDPQIFERITDKQEAFIHFLCNESMDFDRSDFDSKLIYLTGFPSVENLSKQEASFIIDMLKGETEPDDTPRYPKKESTLREDARFLPTAYQIKGIRESVKSLGWDEAYFNTWLKKRTGESHIKTLDRNTAQNALGALMKLRQLRYTI